MNFFFFIFTLLQQNPKSPPLLNHVPDPTIQAPPQSQEWAKPSRHVHRTKVSPNPNPRGMKNPNHSQNPQNVTLFFSTLQPTNQPTKERNNQQPPMLHLPKQESCRPPEEESDFPTPGDPNQKNTPIPQTLLIKLRPLRAPKWHPIDKNQKCGRRTATTQKPMEQNKKTTW